jgi:superfamily II DNA or RNA helicase
MVGLLSKHTNMKPLDYIVKFDEGTTKVYPLTQEIIDLLTIKVRTLEPNGRGGRNTVYTNEPLFVTELDDFGFAWASCDQGVWKDLSDHLRKKGHTVLLEDFRQPFPEAQIIPAMRCLRDYQKPWIEAALSANHSGLIGAVTRFGKTYGMEAVCRAYPDLNTIIVAPGRTLCKQIYDHFTQAFCPDRSSGIRPTREVCGVFTSGPDRGPSKQPNGITVISVDSLHKADPAKVQLIVADEPHALVTPTRLDALRDFYQARKYGFGATLNGRFDKADARITAYFGPVLSNVGYLDAVKMGAVSRLKVLFLKVKFSKDTIPGNWNNRDLVMQRLLLRSTNTAALVKRVINEAIPPEFQMMAFIVDEKQGNFYMEHAIPNEGTLVMAKLLKPKEQDRVTSEIAASKYMRVLASNMYVQGVTFPDLQVVINLASGGGNTTAIQKPGRLLQNQPGKNYGVLIDLMFECRDSEMETRRNPPYAGIIGECWARQKAYKEIGYEIEYIDTIEELAEQVKASRSYAS